MRQWFTSSLRHSASQVSKEHLESGSNYPNCPHRDRDEEVVAVKVCVLLSLALAQPQLRPQLPPLGYNGIMFLYAIHPYGYVCMCDSFFNNGSFALSSFLTVELIYMLFMQWVKVLCLKD